MSRQYLRRQPWTLGPAWPEPLVASAPFRLAAHVVEHALHVDLHDPRRTLGVLRWLTTVLPDEGAISKRMILPEAIKTAEAVLKGKLRPNAIRNGRRLKPEHRPALEALIQEHRAHGYRRPPQPAEVDVLDL